MAFIKHNRAEKYEAVKAAAVKDAKLCPSCGTPAAATCNRCNQPPKS